MPSDKYKYLAKNTLLFTISSFGSKLLVFFLVPLYTNVLSTSEYGIADLITTTGTLLGYVFTIDIASSVLRFAIDQKENQHQYLSYGIRVLLSGSAVFAMIVAGMHFFKTIAWNDYCYFFLFFEYFVLALNSILNNYLRAIDKVKEVAVSGIITTLVTILLNIALLLFFKWGLLGYLIAVTTGSFVSSLYCLFVIHKPIKLLLFDCCAKEKRLEMLRYSFPLIFNGIAWWMNNSLDKYFVTWMCGTSENGILSVAYKIPTILTVFYTVFSQAWNLSAIKEFDKDDKDGFFAKTYSMFNAGSVIICSGLILFNIPMAKILFAKDFFVAWQYSSILLFATLFSSLSGILGSVFSAVKQSKMFAVSTVIAAIVNCILNGLLIYLFGTIGAAIATVISFICVWAIRLIYTKKYINWKLDIVRDIIAYSLICIQIVFEHCTGHFYVGQAVAFVVLIVIYRQYISGFYKLAKQLVRLRRG